MARKNPDLTSAARHGRLRRSASWANLAKLLLTTVLVVAISGVSVGAYAVWGLVKEADTVELVPTDTSTPEAVAAGTQSLNGELTILLVGTDTRKGQSFNDGEEGELNDVNLLLHVPADHKSATIISFPRDLMIPIPSCPGPKGEPEYYGAMSEQPLNSSIQYGGLPCIALTVSKLTGMDIPYAAMVDFNGVIKITNAIGGVTVCLDQPIVDPNSELDLPAGDVTLQGWQALQFLRTRYGVGDGSDVSRISNQQVYMSALVKQLRSAETLSNPIKVYGLAKAGFESLQLSSSMASIQFLQALAGTVVDIDLERINFVQYPSGRHASLPGKLSPDRYSADQLFKVVQSGEPFVVSNAGRAVVDHGAAAKTESTDPETGEPIPTPDPIVLPGTITGQNAASTTCSAGRTIW